MFEPLRKRTRKVKPCNSGAVENGNFYQRVSNKQMAGGGGKFMQKIEVCFSFVQFNIKKVGYS